MAGKHQNGGARPDSPAGDHEGVRQPAAAGRLVAAVVTGLGLIYIAGAICFWHTDNLVNYLLYVVTAIIEIGRAHV